MIGEWSQIEGETCVTIVPGGMIVRTFTHHSEALCFVPGTIEDLAMWAHDFKNKNFTDEE